MLNIFCLYGIKMTRYTHMTEDGPISKGEIKHFFDKWGNPFLPETRISFKFFDYGWEDLDILAFLGIIEEKTAANADYTKHNLKMERSKTLIAIDKRKPSY